MKIYSAILATLIAIYVTSVGCSKSDADVLKTTSDQKIVIEKTTITINGQKVPVPLQLKSLIAILGQPDKTHELINTIRVWDKLGIYCYTKPESTIVGNLAFLYLHESYAFSPKCLFEGALVLDDFAVDRNTTGPTLVKVGFLRDDKPGLIPYYIKNINGFRILVDTEKDRVKSVSLSLPTKAEQAGDGQSAPLPESKSKGSDKPQPEAEGNPGRKS